MEYINGEPMWYACMAMGIQEEQTSCKTISTTESAKLHEQLPYQNIAQQTIRKDYTAQQKQVPSQTSVRTEENAVANKSDDTDSTANHREVKYNELRAKETKLKKMEELIKQKGKTAQEVNNNRTKLESRCQEIESRNYELEQTVKTLMKRIESLELTNIHDNRSETNKGDSGTKNHANFSRNNASMTDYFNHRFMHMQQKLTDVSTV
jgi:seryl-tRNA synthetase